jgi:hypothetical protein
MKEENTDNEKEIRCEDEMKEESEDRMNNIFTLVR